MKQDKADKLLDDIYEGTLELLLSKIKDKSATAADLAVARAMLKDNNISSIPTKKNALGSLTQSLAPLKMDGLVEDFLN